MAAAASEAAAAAEATSPPQSEVLAGWLYKLSTGRVKTYKWRWFVFDPYTGYLNFFKSKAPTATACGHIDMAACRSIETTDPELKRFVLNLPSRQITLMSSGPEETIYWMEELLERKSLLIQRADDTSKDEDFPDWEVLPSSELGNPGALMGVQDGPLSPGFASGSGLGSFDGGAAGAENGEEGGGAGQSQRLKRRLDAGEITQAEYERLSAVLSPESSREGESAPPPGGDANGGDGVGGGGATRGERSAALSPATLSELTKRASSRASSLGDIAAAAADTALQSGPSSGRTDAEVNAAVKAAVAAAEEAVQARCDVQIAAAAEELRARDETIALLEKEVVDMDRELTLKDKAIELLQRQLRAEQEARREESRHGVTFAEMQERLIKAQTDLTHTKAILDLQNHRIAAAMHQVVYYRSVVEGASKDADKEAELLHEQLAAQDQQLQVSELAIENLRSASDPN